MRKLRSQQGAALVTALMLTVLALVIAMALLTMTTVHTDVSASRKRYLSSVGAARGGVELLAREILPRLLQNPGEVAVMEEQHSLIALKVNLSDCLKQKLDRPAAGWNKCSAAEASANAARAPDVVFRLSGVPPAKGFTVTSKIIDTVPGNTDRSGNELLDEGNSVATRDEVIRPQHVPAIYNLSVQGSREETGMREKANLSVLYAY